jgi:DNA-binding MurR/RpiR family transcriptional regulator
VLGLIRERLERGGMAVQMACGLEPRHRARLAALASGAGVLAVAVGNETRVAEAAVSAARQAGVPAAALVDSSLSPLARVPLARVVPADERAGAPGLVALVAVAQALAASLVPAARTAGLAAVGA